MKAKGSAARGSSVDIWWAEEEQREPGFMLAMDRGLMQEAWAAELRALRRRSHLSRAKVAAKAGIDEAALARAESGRVMPSTRVLFLVAEALNCAMRLTFARHGGRSIAQIKRMRPAP